MKEQVQRTIDSFERAKVRLAGEREHLLAMAAACLEQDPPQTAAAEADPEAPAPVLTPAQQRARFYEEQAKPIEARLAEIEIELRAARAVHAAATKRGEAEAAATARAAAPRRAEAGTDAVKPLARWPSGSYDDASANVGTVVGTHADPRLKPGMVPADLPTQEVREPRPAVRSAPAEEGFPHRRKKREP